MHQFPRFVRASAFSMASGLSLALGIAAAPALAGEPPAKADSSNEARALLAASGEAIAKLKALSYTASAGSATEGGLKHAASITLVRAEAGGWKARAQGKATASSGETTDLNVGFDGATAWAVKEKDKSIFTRAIRKDTDLSRFFRGHGAGPIFAWEMLADKPMAFGSSATISMGDPADVGGVKCRVVVVTRGKDSDDDDSGATVRYFIADSDKLPRQIERTVETPGMEGKPAKTFTRTLTLADVRTDSAVTGVAFEQPSLDGYAIRTDRPKREEPKKPEPSKSEQPPLAGPDVTDKGDKVGEIDKSKLPASEKGLLAVGSQSPDFRLKDPEGKEWTLADYKGKVLLVDFWGTWCPPCRAAMPGIQRLHEKYKDKPVAVVGFNSERRPDADPAKYMKDKKFTYQLLLNSEKVASRFKVPGWPTFYVIDHEGKVLWGGVGHSPEHEKDMAKAIDYALSRMQK